MGKVEDAFIKVSLYLAIAGIFAAAGVWAWFFFIVGSLTIEAWTFTTLEFQVDSWLSIGQSAFEELMQGNIQRGLLGLFIFLSILIGSMSALFFVSVGIIYGVIRLWKIGLNKARRG